MTVNYIKQKMNDGHAVLGPFLKMNDPALIEQAALAGFDFCIIDMEHGPISFESAQNHLNIFRKGQEGCAVIHVLPNILM